MVSVELSDSNSNALPYAAFSCYLFTLSTSGYIIFKSLRKAYQGLPIALRSREQDSRHQRAFRLYGLLALANATLILYAISQAVIASYQIWAHGKNVNSLEADWKYTAWIPGHAEKPKSLRLGAWMDDTDLFLETTLPLVKSARNFWWLQQSALGQVIFGVFVAIESRRRNIPYPWAYLYLGQITGLGVVQSLFALAMVLTPVPLVREAILSNNKPASWTPRSVFFTVPVALSAVITVVLPFLYTNVQLVKPLIVTLYVLPYVPLIATHSHLVPLKWGTIHLDIHKAHSSSLTSFRFSSFVSVALHFLSILFFFITHPPPTHRRGYNPTWMTHPREPLNPLQRFNISVYRIFNALSSHATAASVAWDVLLSGVTLCIIAGLRHANVSDILAAAGLWKSGSHGDIILPKLGNHITLPPDASPDEATAVESSALESKADKKSRTRARPSKRAVSTSSSADPDDAYVPPPATAAALSTAEHEEESNGEGVVDAAEGAAVAWALFAVGGLGTCSAGVLGGEVVSR